jgi:hypothetical protein|tara:strand:+ start:6519 stop:6782 length:264 start_codon:yes stop_codon:yes gene_type:complete
MAGLVSASFKQGKETMKILILQDTVANKQRVHAGDIVEVEQTEGNILIGYGKASVSDGKKKEKKETNRSVGLENSDKPAPKKRSKSK